MTSAIHQPVSRQARSRPLDRGRATPHKLVVLGVDAADVVSHAGGLICDSVRAGLQVEVYLESMGRERALQILGADARVLPDRFDFGPECPDAVFFAGTLHERNSGVRRLVSGTTRHRSAEVACWGTTWPPARDTTVSIEHQLSCAARAFKHHAVTAVGMAGLVTPTESFRGGRRADLAAQLPWR